MTEISGICALLLVSSFLPGLGVAAIFCAERASFVPLVIWAVVMAVLAMIGMA